jgi:hypothetical protein
MTILNCRDVLELLLSLLFALGMRHDGPGAFGCAMEWTALTSSRLSAAAITCDALAPPIFSQSIPSRSRSPLGRAGPRQPKAARVVRPLLAPHRVENAR